MTDSLADLLKRQQQSSKPTPDAPEAPPHDEAAEVAAIAKQQAAKAAVVAGRLLGKATVFGTKKTIEASHQAKQRLAEVTPEQWVKIREVAKKAGLVVLALAGIVIIIWGGTKAWHAWHAHHTATAVEPSTAARPKAVEKGPDGPKPITGPVQVRMPDGTIKTITIMSDRTIKAVVTPDTAGKPVSSSTPAVPPQVVVVEAKPSVTATAVEPSTMTRQTEATERPAKAAPPPQAVPQPPRQSQGVNARYRHTAPVLIQQKYQPNPVAKQHPADPQEQQNMKALDQFFDKLNKEKPTTQKGNTNGSHSTHQ